MFLRALFEFFLYTSFAPLKTIKKSFFVRLSMSPFIVSFRIWELDPGLRKAHTLKSYLEYRYQKVQMGSNINSNTIYSEWKRSSHGVPQGPILGALIFLMYINYLCTILNNISLFVDDTSVIITNTLCFILYYTALYSFYELFHILVLKRIYGM